MYSHYCTLHVCSALTVFQVLSEQRTWARPSEQSWMAFLLPLALLVCQHCLAYGQYVPRRLGCAHMQHLKLPSSPTQTSWRNTHTHIYADCLFYVRLPYIPWFQLTAADVSQLAQRPNLNKGGLSQVGHMSSWRLQSLFFPHRELQNSACVKFLVSFSIIAH